MKTFGELLTDFMARTGTSDSELARTLGVRRQTIFRWKEGLTERPRRREDVLLCAKKLRLTDSERDELLLAAGFAPETPPPSEPMVVVAPPPVVAPVIEPAPIIIPQPTPRRISKRFWLTFAVAIILIIGIGIAIVTSQSQIDYPMALAGEQLVIIASFDPASSIATPEAPSRRLSGDASQASSNDLASRLQIALEREVRAARLDNVRVVRWRDQIHDATSAENLRQRTNASVVVWGNLVDGKYSVAFTFAPRVNDMPLDALVAVPDVPLVIATSPDEIQTTALLIVSQLYLANSDTAMARAVITQAMEHALQAVRANAAMNLYAGYTFQLAKPPTLGDAIQFYSQTITFDPTNTSAYLNRGVAYVRLNDAQWQVDFVQAQDRSSVRLAQCWAFALDQKPDLALPHCDAAMSQDSSARSREARAIVYAELGRLKEASADLAIVIDWLGRQSPELRARYGSSRADWLQELQAGKNPFSEMVLNKLRQE